MTLPKTLNQKMNPHEIHQRNRGIVKNALENAGYKCAQPSADAKGVDFIVTPPEGGTRFDLQVRSRLYFGKKILPHHNLHIAFPDKKGLVLYHHGKLLDAASSQRRITHTRSWKQYGWYSQCPTPAWACKLPDLHRIASGAIGHARPTSSALPTAKKTNAANTIGAAFSRVIYDNLNARQKENYNFHKVAAAMSDCGFNAMPLTDDWKGADFIAVHIDGETMLRVQLKGRFGFDQKYRKKNLWIAFRDSNTGDIYVYPHDKLLAHYIARFEKSDAWRIKGIYHFPSRTPDDEKLLAPYQLTRKE